jgi:hypothetical protein
MVKICVHIIQWILTPMYNVCIACTLAFVLSSVHRLRVHRVLHATTAECQRREFTTTVQMPCRSHSSHRVVTRAIGLPDAKVDKDMDDDKSINKRPRSMVNRSRSLVLVQLSVSLSLLLMDHLADCRSELPTTKGGGGFEDKYEYQPEEQGGAGDDSDSSHHDRPLTTISVLQKGIFLAARSQMVLGLRVTSLVSRLLSLRKAWQTWI